MLRDGTASFGEVAAAMGRDEAWLRRNWRRLNRHHGFPHKIPGALTFPRDAVDIWLASSGAPAGGAGPQAEPANQNDPLMGDDYVARYAAALLERTRT